MDRNCGVLFRDEQHEWRFRVTDSANGQTIAQSEGYAHRFDAVKALERLGVAEQDIFDTTQGA